MQGSAREKVIRLVDDRVENCIWIGGRAARVEVTVVIDTGAVANVLSSTVLNQMGKSKLTVMVVLLSQPRNETIVSLGVSCWQ